MADKDFLIVEDARYEVLEVTTAPPGPRGLQGATGPQGPPGPQGVQGEVGPQGVPGDAADGSFVYEQVEPSATWTINHALTFQPSVTVVDSSGNEVVGRVRYVDSDTIVVEFDAAFGGKVYLS